MTSTRDLIGLLALLLALTGAADLGAADDAKGSVLPTDWPRLFGPFDTGVTGDCGVPLVGNMKQAKLLWISEERNLGLGWGLGHGSSGYGKTTMRSDGYAGPIVVGKRVLLQYYVPHGDIVVTKDTRGRRFNFAEKKDPRRESWAMEALDTVLCMDAATGKTLWKAELPGGTSWNMGRGGPFQHPCVVDGMVYVQGTGGLAHALDLVNGSVRWTAELGPGTERWKDWLKQRFAQRQALGGQVFDVSPNHADGVVCFNDQSWVTGKHRDSGLAALDAATGKLLWAHERVLGRLVVPTFWRHGSKTYVIAVSGGKWRTPDDRIRCFELRSGNLAWEIEGAYSVDTTPLVFGDRLLVSTTHVRSGLGGHYRKAKEKKRVDPAKTSLKEWAAGKVGWRCYRLRPDAPPEELWTLPLTYGGSNPTPAFYKDRLYLQTTVGSICVDAAEGKLLATGPKIDNHMPMMISGDRLISYAHMLDISDPKRIVEAGKIRSTGGWKPIPYSHSCLSDGRLYLHGWLTDEKLFNGDAPERGAIACFDLRAK